MPASSATRALRTRMRLWRLHCPPRICLRRAGDLSPCAARPPQIFHFFLTLSGIG